MFIPDCRTDDTYNEKYLKNEDASVVIGYDLCAEDGIENFFNNIEVYEQTFDNVGFNAENGLDFNDIDHNLLVSNKLLGELTPEEIENASKITLWLMTFKECMAHWAEMSRDEYITAMIDNMEEAEYQRTKALSDAGKYKNDLILHREYMEEVESGNVPTCWEYTKDPENGNVIKIGHCPNGRDVVIND